MANLLLNRSFEEGWHHPVEGAVLSGWHHMRFPLDGEQGVTELGIPNDWDFRWADASVENPYWDGEPYNLFVAPEIIHLTRKDLPEHEWDDFILDGDWTLKAYKRGAWCAGFSQSVYLEKGTYRFTVRLFADLVSSYKGGKQWALDLKSGNLRFTLADRQYTWESLLAGTSHERSLLFSAEGSTTIGFVLLCPFALANSGFFIDDLTLELEEEEPVPDRQYDRVVHLIPQDATKEEIAQVVEVVTPNKRTFTWSADDAFLTAAALKTRTVDVWDVERISVDPATLEAWVKRFYPPLPNIVYRSFEPVEYWEDYLLWQRDPRWRDKLFGSRMGKMTIGNFGCYITDLASAMRIFGLDSDATPVSVDAALGTEGYTPGTAWAIWSVIRTKLGINIQGGTESNVIHALNRGNIAQAEVLPKSLEHFVLVVERFDDGDYLMLDPLKNVVAPLHDHYDGVESWRILSPVEKPLPPPPPPKPLGELLTLHLQTPVPGWLDYVAAVKPAWVKLVGNFEAARDVKRVSPGTKVLIRQHEDDNEKYFVYPYSWQAASQFLDRFWDSIALNAPWIDAVEGLNETIPSGNMTRIQQAVDFAVAFADELAARCEDAGIEGIVPCLLNTAVGNPQHGYETEKLVPAARAAIRHGGYIGYHPYFPAHVDHAERWLEEEGYHHHMRALESWDATFAKHGLKPKYLFTEMGAIGMSVRPDGRPGAYDDKAGWRAALDGDLPRYVRLLVRCSDMVNEWNAEHDNRAEALAIFTSGEGVGWRHFQMKDPELTALAAALGR